MADTTPTPSGIAVLPALEGSDLTRWRREMVMFLALRGQAGSWAFGRTATGLPDLTQEAGESADAKAMRRKGAADAVSAASAMMQSIPASRRSNLALTDPERYNPDKVWDAVTTLCLGSVADAQGEDIAEELAALTEMPITDLDGATIDPHLEASVAELFRRITDIRARADAYQSTCDTNSKTNEYQISTRQLLNTAIRLLIGSEAEFRVYRPAWRELKTIAYLRASVLRDRRELDRDNGGGSTSRAFVSHDEKSALMAMIEALQDEMKQLRVQRTNGGGGGGGGTRHSDATLRRVGQPPDTNRKWQWCDRHKRWSTSHSTAECRLPESESQ